MNKLYMNKLYMNKLFIYILACILFVYILMVIIENNDVIKYFLYSSTYKSVPTNNNLVNDVIHLLEKNKIMDKKYTFVDFGSGHGNVLIKFNQYFNKLIGIELDPIAYNKSIQLTKSYQNIEILNKSMENFKINDDNIIIYMYEPLWTESCQYRYKVYNKVFNNFTTNKNVYIVYITSNSLTDKCVFNKNITNKHVHIDVISSNLWPFSKKIYLFKL